MKRSIRWTLMMGLLSGVALTQTGCGTSTGYVREDQSIDDATYASPESAVYSPRPTFPMHTEGP
jgi:hypothetical protein